MGSLYILISRYTFHAALGSLYINQCSRYNIDTINQFRYLWNTMISCHEELRHPRKNWSRTIFWTWQAKELNHPPRMFQEKAIHLLSLTLNIKDQKENFKYIYIYIFNQHKNGCNIRKINYKRIFMKKQYQIIIKDLKHPRKDWISTISQAQQKQKILVSHGKCFEKQAQDL